MQPPPPSSPHDPSPTPASMHRTPPSFSPRRQAFSPRRLLFPAVAFESLHVHPFYLLIPPRSVLLQAWQISPTPPPPPHQYIDISNSILISNLPHVVLPRQPIPCIPTTTAHHNTYMQSKLPVPCIPSLLPLPRHKIKHPESSSMFPPHQIVAVSQRPTVFRPKI